VLRELAPPTIVLFVSMVYAIVRYVVFGGSATAQIPLFIANKAIAVAGLVMIGWASLARGPRRKSYGTTGFLLTLLHVLITLLILNPLYFGKLFSKNGFLEGRAEVSLLAGALGMLLLYVLSTTPSRDEDTRSLIPRAGRVVLALSALHVLAIGYPAWGTPAAWPGWLPPITMLSFILAVVFLMRLR
jgi:hypothetical protein